MTECTAKMPEDIILVGIFPGSLQTPTAVLLEYPLLGMSFEKRLTNSTPGII